MLDGLRGWLLSIAAAALILTVLRALLPKGSIQGIARVTAGLVLLIVLLRPVVSWDAGSLRLRYQELDSQIDRQIAAYQADSQSQMQGIIEEKTAAYISEQAQQLGLTCRAVVRSELRDGAAYPVEVTLDIPRSSRLSDVIAQELDIPASRQIWQGGDES